MAAVVIGVGTASTLNTTSYATGNYTPAAGDLIFVFVTATGTTAAAPTLVDSQAGTYTLVATALKNVSADRLYAFVADQAALALSQTITFDCSADAATGCVIQAARVSGMTLLGVSAVRQFQVVSNQLNGTTPEAIFSTSVDTGNPTLGLVGNNTNPAGVTIPTGWSVVQDHGYGSPSTGAGCCRRDSGFTGTTMTWGAASSAFGAIIVELDASAGTGQPTMKRYGGIPNMGGSGGGVGGGFWGRGR